MNDAEFENLKKANRSLFMKLSGEFHKLGFLASSALAMEKGEWVIKVGCNQREAAPLSKEVESTVRSLVGTTFDFEGVTYPVRLQFGEAPRL